MKKKYVASNFLVFLMLLSGCGGNESGKTEITFYGWGNETEVSLTQRFVDEYNASQNEIEVKYTAIPSEDYGTKIRNALASRNPPDV